MKKSILTTLLFAVLYFLCMGIGVLLGNLFDQTGNMFYAPAFTALVGGSVYMILVAKVPRFGVDLILVYGLYLLVQLPHQTIIHLIATFLNVLVVALLFLAYTVSLKLQVYFDLSYRNSLKLSLIGIFMSLAAVAKVLLGTVLLVAIGYYMPALLFFVGIGMWHFFISDMLEPIYESIHEKLATK